MCYLEWLLMGIIRILLIIYFLECADKRVGLLSDGEIYSGVELTS